MISEISPEDDEFINGVLERMREAGWFVAVGLAPEDPRLPFMIFAKNEDGVRHHVHSDNLRDAADYLKVTIFNDTK